MTRLSLSPPLLILSLYIVLAAHSQSSVQAPIPRHKVLTPQQIAYQADTAKWLRARNALRIRAQQSLDAEMAREKRGDCPNADSTRAAEECLTIEGNKTQANYAAFIGALRAMLADPYPSFPGEGPYSGPTGTPLSSAELVAEFDKLEMESKLYREHASGAAYDQFKSGTEAPVFNAEASQKLLRLHMQELAFIYGELLSTH